jgi:hypothetical protein
MIEIKFFYAGSAMKMCLKNMHKNMIPDPAQDRSKKVPTNVGI